MTHLLTLTEHIDVQVRTERDLKKLEKLAWPEVVLHADGLILEKDIQGLDAVRDYYQSFFKNYNFSHTLICAAVNETDNTSFTFWVEEDVTPTDAGAAPSSPGWAKQPTTIYGMNMYQFAANQGDQITDIWCERQLTPYEQYCKFKRLVTDYSKVRVDDVKFTLVSPVYKADRARTLEQLALTYMEIWSTANHAVDKKKHTPADKVMAYDVCYANLRVPLEVSGREGFKQLVAEESKYWESISEEDQVAATGGNKAFCHWTERGRVTQRGFRDSRHGFSLLLLDEIDAGTIKEVVEFRPLLCRGEGEQVRKAEE
ncbi:hypothetical protein WJX72_002931 [[Myrmecia] bisecta]|uniref:SnoaL-like domain-containing protein n=1 Tax=[Myrmecia] bisecta TaxID=41462 RepID=A0AAW1QPL0_9CHLO